MPVSQLDPNLIRTIASSGRATIEPDAIDIIIAKLNEAIQAIDAPPAGDGSQRFVYTAVGNEGSQFTITLPAPRVSTSYIAIPCGGASTGIRVYDVILSSRTTTQFTCRSSAALQAGDKIQFYVSEET